MSHFVNRHFARRLALVVACTVLPLAGGGACAGGGSPDEGGNAGPDGSVDGAGTSDTVQPARDAASDEGRRDASSDAASEMDASKGDGGGDDGASDGGAIDAAADSAGDSGVDAAPVPCPTSGTVVTMTNGKVRVDYDMTTSNATFFYDGVTKITNFYAGFATANYVTSRNYTSRSCLQQGNETVITQTAANLPTMRHSFVLDGGNKFLSKVSVEGSGLAVGWISPVVMDTAGGVDVGSYGDTRVLWIPFDNDNWVYYNAMPIENSGTSFEAAAFYDNVTRNGIVVGAVTHDTWKSGVYYSGANHKLNAMNVFGGATDGNWTHDVVPHGKVTGAVVTSPTMFVGYSGDWRDLLEEYGDANVAHEGKLAWSGGVPFGWNSWGKIQSAITYDKAITVSDFIKNNLQTSDFSNNGTAYINLDSYWDNLSDVQLVDFVAHVHANGQKAGIYWAPFVDWGKSATRQVENSSYTYTDVWLRDTKGNPIALDGAYAIDPTHPGTQRRIDYFIDKFKSWGFEYVKLDFLSHGALESTTRSDPNVQTGMQAYNQGMQYVLNRIGGTMFVSESIAPLFPAHYAHARRVACDTYGAALGSMSSQYELNSASYGWWMNGRTYTFNDPDEMVFEGFSANENMTRLLSGVVSGTVFLNGDDLTGAAGQALARAYLTNPRMNTIARLGKAFRPVEGNTGTNPSDVFVLTSGASTYIAVFNFTSAATTKSVDLARAGLNATKVYSVTDVWTGTNTLTTGTLSVPLDSAFSKLFELK